MSVASTLFFVSVSFCPLNNKDIPLITRNMSSSVDTPRGAGFQPFEYGDVLAAEEEMMDLTQDPVPDASARPKREPKKGEWERITRGRVRLTRRHDMVDSPELWVIAIHRGWPEFIHLFVYTAFIVSSFLISTFFIRARRSTFEFAGGILCTALTCIVIILWLVVLRSSPGIVHSHLIRQGRSASQMWSRCDRCNTYRPPRTMHCNTCDVCVEQPDHHCPFFMKCIGKENVRIFNIFFVCMVVTCVVQIAFLVTAFTLRKGSFDGLPRGALIAGLCVLCCTYAFYVLTMVVR